MKRRDVPNLGFGIGLRPVHYPEIFGNWPPIDWFEIITEGFLLATPSTMEKLDAILEHYPVVMHGVSLAIGSPDPLDFEYLKQVKELIRKTGSPWVSDHLCWGKLARSHAHDLLPLPYRKEVVHFVAERARIVQDFLEVPFALENVPSHLYFKGNEMTEWDFYGAVIEEADIPMMLDISNIYVSSRNHGFDPKIFYENLPLERVIQVHLGGYRDFGDYCMDTHDRPISDPVWDLYREIAPRIGPVSTLLEWDDRFVSFQQTWEEVLKAKAFHAEFVGAF